MRALWATFALAATACEGPTEIVLALNTDLEIPRELEILQIQVTERSGSPLAQKTWDLDRNKPGAVGLPATVGLLAGDPDASIRVQVDGIHEGKPIVSRFAELRFARGRIVLLRMDLLRACLSAVRTCPPDQTCGRSGCESAAVEVSALPDYSSELAFGPVP